MIETGLLLIYILLAGLAWKTTFKKSFAESFAPVCFIQILLMIFCGIVFNHVSYGILTGVIIISTVLCRNCIFYVIHQKGTSVSNVAILIIEQLNDIGLLIFLVAFVLCYFFNYHRYFGAWDEFSHWGPFIKETLRLDRLYCTSPVKLGHQDYVPAITMFEAFWCKFCMRYREADAYRAIQMLAFTLIMPAVVESSTPPPI